MILCFLSVEEEGKVETLLGEANGCGNCDGDTLVCRAVKHALLVANLLKVSLCIELAELRNLVTGLDLTGIDEIGNLSTALCGEVTKLENACALKELYKFSLIAFQIIFSLVFQNSTFFA